MILKTIQKRLLRNSITKNQNKRISMPETGSLKTVAVLVNCMEINDLDCFLRLTDALQIAEKDLKIIYYCQEKDELPSMRQDRFYPNEFSWKGTVLNPLVKEFLDREYDLLIGYYTHENILLHTISALAKASLKVGLKGSDEKLFDLIFDVKSENFKAFEEELVKYTGIIFKHKTRS